MSDVDTHIISVLLPASSILVYSQDQETLQAARNMAADWRFARVKMEIHEGDVKAAIASMSTQASPNLMIIQTETIDAGFTDNLVELAGCCDEGTAAIVIGPDNDVNLYRRLIDMGVSDYIVRPVETPVLANIIAKTMIEKIGVTGSRLVAFLGAKGGVGVSMLSAAVACGVSDILEQKTALFDLAGGWSTFGVGLGFEPTATLAQAMRVAENNEEDSLKRMLFRASERLSVLATGGDSMLGSAVDAAPLEKLIDMLMVRYPVVIVDLSQAPETLRRIVLSRANQIIVAATPTLPALRLARGLMSELKDMRGGSAEGLDLVINMQGMAGASEVPKGEIEKAMECSVAAFIPFDSKMFLGNENESRKLTEDKNARALIEKTLLPVVGKTLDIFGKEDKRVSAAAKSGFMSGFLKKRSAK
ncbi:MAG: type II secretion protein ATPase [Alphaproteobacteria bacterium]|nr:type II secretion protein ATPase [Alphaproteobacteria bacterium]